MLRAVTAARTDRVCAKLRLTLRNVFPLFICTSSHKVNLLQILHNSPHIEVLSLYLSAGVKFSCENCNIQFRQNGEDIPINIQWKYFCQLRFFLVSLEKNKFLKDGKKP